MPQRGGLQLPLTQSCAWRCLRPLGAWIGPLPLPLAAMVVKGVVVVVLPLPPNPPPWS